MGQLANIAGTVSRSDFERWSRSLAGAVAMPDGTTLCRVLGEHMLVVTLDDYSVAPHLALDGFWEMWVTICMCKRVRPGWHCIDVGANFGYYTVLLAGLVGEAGKVEAWEPNPDLARLLKRSVRLSGMQHRASVRQSAAHEVAGKRCLFRRKHDYGGAPTSQHSGSDVAHHLAEGELWDELLDVDALPLARTALKHVDFVKIDAEGAEYEIWKSLEGILPKAAVIEWAPKKLSEPEKFLALLAEQGYRVGTIDGDGNVASETSAALLAAPDWKALWVER